MSCPLNMSLPQLLQPSFCHREDQLALALLNPTADISLTWWGVGHRLYEEGIALRERSTVKSAMSAIRSDFVYLCIARCPLSVWFWILYPVFQKSIKSCVYILRVWTCLTGEKHLWRRCGCTETYQVQAAVGSHWQCEVMNLEQADLRNKAWLPEVSYKDRPMLGGYHLTAPP